MRTVEANEYMSFLVDLDRQVSTPFAEAAAMPMWTPDGREILYRDETTWEIQRKAAHGDPNKRPIGVVDTFATPHDVSLDGRYLLFTRVGANVDIGVKDLRGEAKPEILLGTEFDERNPHFSPDGHWFVYSSDASGQTEIFARRFPVTNEVWRISTSGGQQPVWSRNGKEIFFFTLDSRFMAVPVSTSASTLSIGRPESLFRVPVKLDNIANQYGVSADGQRILVAVPVPDVEAQLFRVLVNWRPN